MKIGFLALSGIRVVDPELQTTGLNLPGFVDRSKVIASLPSLGLLTLAGLTPAEHEVRYIDLPDVDAPDITAAHADAIVVGEGEPSWPLVLRDLTAGRLQRGYPTTAPFNLADAPMPRFELLDVSRYNRLTIQTARGCPWHCEFCAASIRLHPSYRTKPIPKIIAELHRIKELWAAPFIEFADDNTFADKRHGHALCEALAGEHVRWFTETDISVARDTPLLEKMRRAGCAQILIGLEDPAEGTEGMELKGNWKARQRARYLEDIRRIQDHGITVNGCFVLGLDTHTAASFDPRWEFIQESELYEIQLTVLTPFPGTPLYERFARDGRLIEPFAWEKRTLFDVTYQPAHLSVAALRKGLLDLAAKVYSKEFTGFRRRQFIRRKLAADERAA